MRYVSTRGEAPAIGFSDAVLAGLAPDGGLYIPQEWPRFTPEEIAAFAGKPYAEVAAAVIGKFAGDDVAHDDLLAMTQAAYATFTHPSVTPIKELYPNLFLLELFHGPTLAFKDVAMQILARLYDRALKAQDRHLTIVAATSGDTGGAAVEAFRGASNARVMILFPEGRISDVQRRFMTTTGEANIANVAVQGSFDDCQTIVKALFQDKVLRQAVDLSGVNSINWARIAAQAVYYFTSAVPHGLLRGAHRQFRRRLRRLCRQADGTADQDHHSRHQRQRHRRAGPDQRPLRPGPGEADPEPGDGHPDRLQLRAPLFRGDRAPRGGHGRRFRRLRRDRRHRHPAPGPRIHARSDGWGDGGRG
jgi:hypothetical protein